MTFYDWLLRTEGSDLERLGHLRSLHNRELPIGFDQHVLDEGFITMAGKSP